jgi:hypothetical protein
MPTLKNKEHVASPAGALPMGMFAMVVAFLLLVPAAYGQGME